MTLKVWMSGLGVEDVLIAAPSQKAAAEAFGMSLYEFRNYAGESPTHILLASGENDNA